MPTLNSVPIPTDRMLGQVFFRSFLLSQGDTDVQQRLFFYVALCHPNWSLRSDHVAQLATSLYPLFSRYLASGWHNPQYAFHKPDEMADLKAEISEQLYVFAGALNHGCPMTREELLEILLSNIIRRDYQCLLQQGGRLRSARVTPVTQTSIHAPFFSHFCHFGLLRKTTGEPVFDHLFAELATTYQQRSSVFRKAMQRGSTKDHLTRVLACHNRAYPADPLEVPAGSV